MGVLKYGINIYIYDIVIFLLTIYDMVNSDIYSASEGWNHQPGSDVVIWCDVIMGSYIGY